MDHYFFLTTGKLRVITKSLEQNDRSETIMSQGSLIYMPRNTAFVSITEEDSILLEFYSQEFDPDNPDINSFKLV